MVEAHAIRPIQPSDDAAVASIIRAVMPEFGADGPGFAIHDPEVDQMCEAYAQHGFAYFVLETLSGMEAAMRLYSKMGFKPLCSPMGATGHHGCDHWYALDLGTWS